MKEQQKRKVEPEVAPAGMIRGETLVGFAPRPMFEAVGTVDADELEPEGPAWCERDGELDR